MDLRNYISQNGIQLDVLSGPDYQDGGTGSWEGFPHHLWEVRLHYAGADLSEMRLSWHTGLGITDDPDVADILDALISESHGYRCNPTFATWADEYGYDTDSIRALTLFQAVEAQATRFAEFLGGWSELDYLAHHYERL